MKRILISTIAILLAILVTQTTQAQSNFESLYGSGVHQYFNGEYQKAYDTLSGAMSLNNRDPRPYYFRGLAAQSLGIGGTGDFQLGAQAEVANGGAASLVNEALQRVQGSTRIRLEEARKEAIQVAQSSGAAFPVQPTNATFPVGNFGTGDVDVIDVRREPSPVDFIESTPVVPGQEIQPLGSSTREPASSTREPASSTREPASSTREPASSTREPASSTREPASSTREPASSTREPASSTREPASSTREPASPFGASQPEVIMEKETSPFGEVVEKETSPFDEPKVMEKESTSPFDQPDVMEKPSSPFGDASTSPFDQPDVMEKPSSPLEASNGNPFGEPKIMEKGSPFDEPSIEEKAIDASPFGEPKVMEKPAMEKPLDNSNLSGPPNDPFNL